MDLALIPACLASTCQHSQHCFLSYHRLRIVPCPDLLAFCQAAQEPSTRRVPMCTEPASATSGPAVNLSLGEEP